MHSRVVAALSDLKSQAEICFELHTTRLSPSPTRLKQAQTLDADSTESIQLHHHALKSINLFKSVYVQRDFAVYIYLPAAFEGCILMLRRQRGAHFFQLRKFELLRHFTLHCFVQFIHLILWYAKLYMFFNSH